MEKMRRRLAALMALVVGVSLVITPAAVARGGRPAHIVSVGSNDIFLVPPGGDGNFSLIAIEAADGSVSGQWHDSTGRGSFLHMEVSCLSVNGNEAWVSGTITNASPDFAAAIGTPAKTRVRDNGRSNTEAEDEIGSTSPTASADDCLAEEPLALFEINDGQVKVS